MHHDLEGLDLFEQDIARQADVIDGMGGRLRAEAEGLAGGLTRPTHVYLVGCGDSFDAGIAARFTWERLLGVPVEAVPAMTFSTSVVDLAPSGALVVGLSVSGRVSRVVEAVRAAASRGLETVTITMNPASPFAQEPSTATWVVDFTKLGAIPGTTSHLVGARAMYELGCALAGGRGDAAAVRTHLDQLGSLVRQAVAECAPTAKEHAEALRREHPVLLIGYGPSMSSARFTVRKLLELTQLVTFWQETEEYAHDEYSLVDRRFNVVQLAPPDRGRTRNAEIASYLKRLDVHLAVVTDGSESDTYAGVADLVYRLPSCPVDLVALLYAIPGQLLALEAARQLGGSLYGMAEQVHRDDGDPQIYESEIVA